MENEKGKEKEKVKGKAKENENYIENNDFVAGHYIGGSVRGTIYGPEKFLPKRMRKFRVMNCEEYIKYNKKVDESGGFDVDGCTGCLSGRISPILPTYAEWKIADAVAEFAALKQGEEGGTPIEYKQLVKATMQLVGGVMYYVTFTGVDLNDHEEKIYRAKVWGKTDLSLSVQCFYEYKNNEKTAGEMREEITAILPKLSEMNRKVVRDKVMDRKALMDQRDGSSDSESGVIRIAPKLGQLQTIGFIFLVKKIKSDNPSWKHAKARKAASRMWRSFSAGEKLPYVIKAEKRFNEKQFPEGTPLIVEKGELNSSR